MLIGCMAMAISASAQMRSRGNTSNGGRVATAASQQAATRQVSNKPATSGSAVSQSNRGMVTSRNTGAVSSSSAASQSNRGTVTSRNTGAVNSSSAASQSNRGTVTSRNTGAVSSSSAASQSNRGTVTSRNTGAVSSSSAASQSNRGTVSDRRPSAGAATRGTVSNSRPAGTVSSSRQSGSGVSSSGAAVTNRQGNTGNVVNRNTGVVTNRQSVSTSGSGSASVSSNTTRNGNVGVNSGMSVERNGSNLRGNENSGLQTNGNNGNVNRGSREGSNVGTVVDRRGNNGNVGNGNYRRPGDNQTTHSENTHGDYNPANNKPQPYGGYRNQHDYDHRTRVIHNSYSRGVWDVRVAPPVRPYRPRYLHVYRPIRPVGWRPVVGIPVIRGFLGLEFGMYYNTSLSYLYSNGYYIDGFYDNVVYLRDVMELDYYWPDVMLQYDDYNRLVYAQMIYSTAYADRTRLRRIYRQLCLLYGSPVTFRDDEISQISWYGGNGEGYVTLRYARHGGRYFTTVSYGY